MKDENLIWQHKRLMNSCVLYSAEYWMICIIQKRATKSSHCVAPRETGHIHFFRYYVISVFCTKSNDYYYNNSISLLQKNRSALWGCISKELSKIHFLFLYFLVSVFVTWEINFLCICFCFIVEHYLYQILIKIK